MADKIIKTALALFVGLALVSPMAVFVNDAQNSSGVTSSQATLIGLILTIFVVSLAYAGYKKMV